MVPSMTTRDAAAFPLSIGSLTYNWWHHIIDNLPTMAGYVLPALGGVLLVLQILYYWKMLKK
jgi:hypothetical protein